MNKEEIIELIEPVLKENGIQLYEVNWRQEKKNKILQIAIMKNDGSMDLDTCQMASMKISDLLDEANVYEGNYMLEVCSPGAERELRNAEEIRNAIGEHVYAKMINGINGMNDVTGDLVSFDNQVLKIQYKDKTRTKEIEIDYENISKIRLAVRI